MMRWYASFAVLVFRALLSFDYARDVMSLYYAWLSENNEDNSNSDLRHSTTCLQLLFRFSHHAHLLSQPQRNCCHTWYGFSSKETPASSCCPTSALDGSALLPLNKIIHGEAYYLAMGGGAVLPIGIASHNHSKHFQYSGDTTENFLQF